MKQKYFKNLCIVMCIVIIIVFLLFIVKQIVGIDDTYSAYKKTAETINIDLENKLNKKGHYGRFNTKKINNLIKKKGSFQITKNDQNFYLDKYDKMVIDKYPKAKCFYDNDNIYICTDSNITEYNCLHVKKRINDFYAEKDVYDYPTYTLNLKHVPNFFMKQGSTTKYKWLICVDNIDYLTPEYSPKINIIIQGKYCYVKLWTNESAYQKDIVNVLKLLE